MILLVGPSCCFLYSSMDTLMSCKLVMYTFPLTFPYIILMWSSTFFLYNFGEILVVLILISFSFSCTATLFRSSTGLCQSTRPQYPVTDSPGQSYRGRNHASRLYLLLIGQIGKAKHTEQIIWTFQVNITSSLSEIERKRIVNWLAIFQQSCAKGKKYLKKIIIFGKSCRRSTERAGTRLMVRGTDSKGHVANFVETEQIIEASPKLYGSIILSWNWLFSIKMLIDKLINEMVLSSYCHFFHTRFTFFARLSADDFLLVYENLLYTCKNISHSMTDSLNYSLA